MEQNRGNTVHSRNIRLSAVRTFFRYLSLRDPDRLGQVTQVLAIPVKREEKKLIRALSREEMDAIVDAPDRSSWKGRRDHSLLLTMYNTWCACFGDDRPPPGAHSLRRHDDLRGVAWHLIYARGGAPQPLAEA